MKTLNKFLFALIAATVMVSAGAVALAQNPAGSGAEGNQTRPRLAAKNPASQPGAPATGAQSPTPVDDDVIISDEQPAKKPDAKNLETGLSAEPTNAKDGAVGPTASASLPADVPVDAQANRHEQASEEAAVVPYYNNFFNTYRLGPEDVVSVNVFGQDRYSRSGIIIPPSGRISLALIPGGIFVNGKTVDEVAETIKKRYDEYIIDPQVTVSLDKASSYRYSVIGDVGQPGIRMMSHRMTVTEAIGEAGGVLSTGDRSKVVVLRRQADGNLKPIPVNVSAIYKGKAPDVTYLVPGDQVIVPGNKLKSMQKIMTFFPILSFARIFTGGVF
jgi:protein involved in polysaccharide export with SLBB domain